ncbi:NADH-quinone oxidoreductase subunit J family protein [Xylanibacter muris]|uniref:NADH-quinone oxidoreductase subunit J n=1 Tax=Xylanibacter muris TaxID=2736290 RepID=A0ABX2AMN0_9BACT|nr:NADH-quinone oxidoreductase subunit J [Xylanibacter muris]NPD91484.1 NADH-quinone oxidoreductase subunit J [Xylanibacter muris]
MANLVMFCILAFIILGSAVMCVTTKKIMRAATFLLFVLFGVAGLYFLLDYTYLAAAQISIYAGGITMMYIFAIQLVGKRTLQGMVERLRGCRIIGGMIVSVIGLATVVLVFLKNSFITSSALTDGEEVPMDVIGNALLGSDKYQYVLPFEFISVFLLACIIGGIIVARKEKETK